MKYNMLIIKKQDNTYAISDYNLTYLAETYVYNLSCITTELNCDTIPHIIQANKQIRNIIEMLKTVNDSNYHNIAKCCEVFLVTLALSKLPIAGNNVQNIISIDFYESEEFINDFRRASTEGPINFNEVHRFEYKGNVGDKIKELSDSSNFNKQTKLIKEFIKVNS